MKKLFCIGILIVSTFLSCTKTESPSRCITKSAKDFCHTESCNNGVQVDQYKFQNEMVFVFDPGNCDADKTSEVIDSNCNSMGYLGGVSGNTMINGEDFSHATFVKTVQNH